MEEIWKVINGSLGKYEVSTNGEVRNSATKLHLKQSKTRKYHYVSMCFEKRVRKMVHKLVAEAFLPNPNNLPQVNHKDENRENNHVDNLEWCTASYNARYGNRNKKMLLSRQMNKGPKRERPVIGTKDGENYYYCSILDASRKTGVDFSNISKCCRANCYNKTAGGYVWKYANLE